MMGWHGRPCMDGVGQRPYLILHVINDTDWNGINGCIDTEADQIIAQSEGVHLSFELPSEVPRCQAQKSSTLVRLKSWEKERKKPLFSCC